MKRGGPLRRRTPLRARTGLRRRGRLRPVNRERRERLRERQFGDRADAVRAMPCVVCGARPSDPAHVRSRGAGGGPADMVPLCRAHHAEQHAVGVATFQARHGVDLVAEAARIDAALSSKPDPGKGLTPMT